MKNQVKKTWKFWLGNLYIQATLLSRFQLFLAQTKSVTIVFKIGVFLSFIAK